MEKEFTVKSQIWSSCCDENTLVIGLYGGDIMMFEIPSFEILTSF
jgi:hypothetical protein